MSEVHSLKFKLIWGIILLSLLFFIVRGVQYAIISSYAPLGFAAFLIAIVIAALIFGATLSRRALKLFGVTLILYGIIRILLGALLKVAPIDSVHATESTSAFYFLLSALFLWGGIYLCKNAVSLNR